MMYANSIHTKQLLLLPGIILHWFEAADELQLVSYGHETVPQYTRHSCSDVDYCGFCLCTPGVACIVRPHSEY